MNSYNEEKLAKIRALNEIAENRGQTLAQMSLAWALRHDSVTSVLIGASKPEQVKENARALECAPFAQEELSLIDEILNKD